MNKKRFTDEITKLITIKQAMSRYNMSRYLIMKYTKECGALIKIGEDKRVVRVDVMKFDKWLENATL